MIPELSDYTGRGEWSGRIRKRSKPLIDYEVGGVALNDPSAGLTGYNWTAEYADGAVYIWREDLGESTKVSILAREGITRIGLAFNQNMQPYLCWEEGDGCFLWYYSPSGAMEMMQIADAVEPCLTLDERRLELVSNSDVILSYRNGTSLCARVQRENFATEHVLADIGDSELTGAGMTTGLHMQWRYRPNSGS